MPKPLAEHLYTATPGADATTQQAYRRVLAATLNADPASTKVYERWFRDAIAANPALVIEPCRAAEMTDEDWYFWAVEHPVTDAEGNSVGSIDVLLISSSGRVGIVETKLAYNPGKRRSVLAQILDYAVHLPELEPNELPAFPGGVHASLEEVMAHLTRGDCLLIIAGDELDPRVVKLSQAIIGDHMLNQWELALVELALYQTVGSGAPGFVIVPSLRGMVSTETRNVVRVVIPVDGGKPQIKLERIAPEAGSKMRQRWTEELFFEKLKATDTLAESFKAMVTRIRALANGSDDRITLAWGTGDTGSMTLKRDGQGLIELYLDGTVRFRPVKIEAGLGARANDYLIELRRLFPEPMKTAYPQIAAPRTSATAAELTTIVVRVVAEANTLT